MSKTIELSNELSLPLDIVTMRTAVYGDSGSGKTTLGRLLGEKVHAAGQRFCAIDLKNDWWGFKSSADGSSAGLPVVIFGGPRGDVKLIEDAAAARSLAETVASIDQSVILDFDAMSRAKQERFLAAFLDALYDVNRRPMLLFCDEADRYAPQKPMTQDAIMSLSSSEDIARRGRKRGIGSFWLTQRTAVLNKNVSEFCNLTVIFRTPGSRDLQELEERVGRIAPKDVVKEVVRLAPGLADGEAFFLSSHPKLRKFMPDPVRPVQLPMPWTFDSSATPGIGQRRREPKVLARTDLAAIEQRMASVVTQAKANDPTALKRRVADLEKQLAAKPAAVAAPAPQRKVKTVERFVLKDGQLDRADSLIGKLADAFTKAQDLQAKVRVAADELAAAIRLTRQSVPVAAPATRIALQSPVVAQKPVRIARAAVSVSESNGDGADDGHVGSGALRRILSALAQFHPSPIDDRKLAVLTNVQRGGSTMRGALAKARRHAWVDGGSGSLGITADGLAALGPYDPLPVGAELREYWRHELGDGAAAQIFKVLVDAYPDSIDQATLAEQTGIQAGGSTMRGALAKLRALELCERGGLRASDELFAE